MAKPMWNRYQVQSYLPEQLFRQLEDSRGKTSRAAFVEGLIREGLEKI